MLGVDKNGKPFAAIKVEMTVGPAPPGSLDETTEEGAFQAGVAEWFRADTDAPIGPDDMAEVEEWCSTFRAYAEAMCRTRGITDEDLRAVVVNIGRTQRSGHNPEGKAALTNVAEAAAAEQHRRDLARAATPAAPAPSPPTSE